MIDDILRKSKTILEEVFKNDPNISLMALIQLEASNSLDFVLAGKNLSPTADNLNWVSDILKKILSSNELAIISRIVLLPSNNLFASGLNSIFEVSKESNYMKIQTTQVANVSIKEGYIIYCLSL